MPVWDKNATIPTIFATHSRGLETRRDAWCYNASKQGVTTNISRMVEVYKQEAVSFAEKTNGLPPNKRRGLAQSIVTKDQKKISWTPNLLKDLEDGKSLSPDSSFLIEAIYRPFSKLWAHCEKNLVWSRYSLPSYFPEKKLSNRVIIVPGPGESLGFTALMLSSPPDVHTLHGGQCFPRWIYERAETAPAGETVLGDVDLLKGGSQLRRRDAITDAGLAHFQTAYPGETITKDDLFHYTYGVLHSPDYRARFADNLSKQLPRIPAVATVATFRAFVSGGRELADLHCSFDEVEPYPAIIAQGDLRLAHIPDPVRFYRVEKMKFGGKRPKLDRTTVIYNPNITITGIPLEAYDYVVNGKPALEWVMERQCVKTDPASGIVSDANAFANETVEDPAYPFKLFCRVVTVSLRTMEIVRSLPPLDIAPNADMSAPDSGNTGVAADEELETANAAAE